MKKHINLGDLSQLKKILRNADLNTVCEHALCPNIAECFTRGTATFLILGNLCTRNCRFCAIHSGKPLPPDPDEPYRIAETIHRLNLKYAVITSVTRDDLSDGGTSHFARTIQEIRKVNPAMRIEVLVPDFKGDLGALQTVINAQPDVFNHNIETVQRLYIEVRPEADYFRSLKLIHIAKEHKLTTKSGVMIGLGETEKEVFEAMKDLHSAGCDILTIGQYFAPSRAHYPVHDIIKDSIFENYRKTAFEIGFLNCVSAPYVRSSYRAECVYNAPALSV